MMNSSSEMVKETSSDEMMAGATIGSVTRRNVPKALSPRSADASSRLRSKPSKPEISTETE